MMKNILIGGLIVLGLSSCFKEDNPIEPHKKGDIEEEVIPMTQYYVYQVYFNLATGEQVSLNKKSEFDLCFSSRADSYLIRLNTASFLKAAITPFATFEQVTDTTGLNWKFDKSDGNPDSTALRNWMKIEGTDTIISDKVWVIDRGVNEQGFPLGLVKVKFHGFKNNIYHFTYGNMDNLEMHEIFVSKNPGHNYVQFQFKTEENLKQIEPATNNWDLLFTQYTTLLITDDGDPYPYLVTGTFINEVGTTVAFDSTLSFNDVVIDDVLFMEYSNNFDVIGYEWKELFGDINGGDFYYKARSNYNYFIRTKDGLFYKLHFTGFYNRETGEKGYPTFEFQRL